jgi:predicted lipoprotein with Yx(FWY)xxD motif
MAINASMGTRHPGAVRLSAALGVSLGAALLAACSSSSAASTSSTSSAPAASASAGAASASASATGGSTTGLVITTKSGSAGAFLTTGSGRTVYLWMKDGKDSSACAGGCASYWPPVTTTGPPTAAGGVSMAGLTTFTRADGTKQVAYDGHALYYFAEDSGPGQVTGQGNDGFGALWWLVNPAGTAITGKVTVASGAATPSTPASASSPPAHSGY